MRMFSHMARHRVFVAGGIALVIAFLMMIGYVLALLGLWKAEPNHVCYVAIGIATAGFVLIFLGHPERQAQDCKEYPCSDAPDSG